MDLAPLLTGQILRCAYYTTGVVLVSIILNVINQLVFYNRKEPPVVFHWVPFIGSTVSYGIDPYRFFFASREKVCFSVYCHSEDTLTERSSTVTSSLLSY